MNLNDISKEMLEELLDRVEKGQIEIQITISPDYSELDVRPWRNN